MPHSKTECWTRYNSNGGKYMVCIDSKGQKGHIPGSGGERGGGSTPRPYSGAKLKLKTSKEKTKSAINAVLKKAIDKKTHQAKSKPVLAELKTAVAKKAEKEKSKPVLSELKSTIEKKNEKKALFKTNLNKQMKAGVDKIAKAKRKEDLLETLKKIKVKKSSDEMAISKAKEEIKQRAVVQSANKEKTKRREDLIETLKKLKVKKSSDEMAINKAKDEIKDKIKKQSDTIQGRKKMAEIKSQIQARIARDGYSESLSKQLIETEAKRAKILKENVRADDPEKLSQGQFKFLETTKRNVNSKFFTATKSKYYRRNQPQEPQVTLPEEPKEPKIKSAMRPFDTAKAKAADEIKRAAWREKNPQPAAAAAPNFLEGIFKQMDEEKKLEKLIVPPKPAFKESPKPAVKPVAARVREVYVPSPQPPPIDWSKKEPKKKKEGDHYTDSKGDRWRVISLTEDGRANVDNMNHTKPAAAVGPPPQTISRANATLRHVEGGDVLIDSMNKYIYDPVSLQLIGKFIDKGRGTEWY